MSKHGITIIALLISMMSAASARELNPVEKGYIELALGTMVVLDKCLDYAPMPDSMTKIRDENGIGDDIEDALTSLVYMHGGEEYDRTKLIPEVTWYFNKVMDQLMYLSEDKNKFCRKTAPIFRARGTIKHVGD